MTYSSPLPSFSSPASSRLPAVRRASFSGQLAFLVHSQETVANHMPPDVDNKALARQKRRRTRYVADSSSFCSSIWQRAHVRHVRIRHVRRVLVRARPTARELFGLLPRGQATLQHGIAADHARLQQGRRRYTQVRVPEEPQAQQNCPPRNCQKGRAWRKRGPGTTHIAPRHEYARSC